MTTIHDFIYTIIKHENIDNIIDEYPTQSMKGIVYESLWNICIKLGFCDLFPSSQYIHKTGNSNTGKLKDLDNLNKYMSTTKINNSNANGCFDIILYNKIIDTFVFISSKYPKISTDVKEEKSIKYYDVQNILSMIDDNKFIYKKYEIYLLVPDKKTVLEKVKNANKSSKYITKYMDANHIMDKNNLNKYFLALKNNLTEKMKLYNKINFNELYAKEKLQLRFHQELITQKTCSLINEGNKSFLWGCKCRSGKTYMVGGIIIKQYSARKKLNVMIITPAPTETSPQFTEDLFDKFNDFNEFKIHHIKNSKSLLNIKTCVNNIFIVSKQLLQKYINDDTVMKIKKLDLDIIAFDENHYGGTTNLSKDIFLSYCSKNTIRIYLTATYNKPLKEWNIPADCQLFRDSEDEQICKSILENSKKIVNLNDKHGKIYVTETVNYYKKLGMSLNDIFDIYLNMPEMHLITNMFDSERYETIKKNLNKETKLGFCFETLLSLNRNKNKFCFENEVKIFLRYISGSYKEVDGEKTIFTRINKICSEIETRTPFTQIWFLPPNNIDEISKCLNYLINEDTVLKRYEILCVNRKNKCLAKDVKDEINKKEIEAKTNGKSGLILLAGNMLTLGITLNLCDLVLLMNDSLSSDKVLQQMYRCMTEGDDKKIGLQLVA